MTEVLVVKKPVHYDLFCKSLDWFLYNRDFRHERFKKNLFLHVVKHNLLLLFFVFLSDFSFTNIDDQRTAGEEGGYLLISFLQLTPTSQTFRHQLGYCCRELTTEHRWQPESKMEPLVDALQNSLFLHQHWVAVVVGRMLKTRVTLGNISRVLLNGTKRLIFVMFKVYSFLSMFTVNIPNFSLVHQ